MRKQLRRGQVVRLEQVERGFADWRARREERRIPDDLWRSAEGLVTDHGLSVSRVSRRLRLSPGDLKRRVLEARRRGSTRGAAIVRRVGAGFARIELPAIVAPEVPEQRALRVRIEGADGVKVEVLLPGRTVSSLIRALEELLG